MKVGILTISDRCYAKQAKDSSGPGLKKLVESDKLLSGAMVTKTAIVPDEEPEIIKILIQWCDENNLDIIFTTGGTGFSPRDVTPEAVKKVIDRETPGLSVRIITQSLNVTPLAMLSRPVCGIRKKTLILTFPGSSKASQECFGFVAPALKHAVQLLTDAQKEVEQTHSALQKRTSCGCSHKETGAHPNPDAQAVITDVTQRSRTCPYPMLSVAEAQAIVFEHAYKLPTKRIMCSAAYGLTAAEDILSVLNLPPFAASIKDGYAVIASDGAGLRKLIGTSMAGSMQSGLPEVTSGWCLRINTGAPMPPGADAVIQIEDTLLTEVTSDRQEEAEIRLLTAPVKGQDIRPEGSDIHRTELLVAEGSVIGAAEMGMLVAGGLEYVSVYPKPMVSLLSTGNELQTAHTFPLQKDHIYDSNKVTLQCLLKSHDIDTVDIGIAKDTKESLVTAIKSAFDSAHILVTTGGVSMGEKDLLRPVLIAEFQAEIHFARVFMKPGKPTTFATCQYKGHKKLILGLPGNPVSATVTSYLYLIPLCHRISGVDYENTIVKVKLSEDMRLDPRPDYHRVVVSWNEPDGIPVALSTGNQISSRLLSMSSAQALLQLPPANDQVSTLSKGDLVSAILMRL